MPLWPALSAVALGGVVIPAVALAAAIVSGLARSAVVDACLLMLLHCCCVLPLCIRVLLLSTPNAMCVLKCAAAGLLLCCSVHAWPSWRSSVRLCVLGHCLLSPCAFVLSLLLMMLRCTAAVTA